MYSTLRYVLPSCIVVQKSGKAAEEARRERLLVEKADKVNGLPDSEVEILQQQYGKNELVEEKVHPCIKFMGYFWGPMPIMIWLAIIVELVKACIQPSEGEGWADFAVLVVLQAVNGTVGYIEERNAGNAIQALKDRLAQKCRVCRNGR